jgi:hypothetical protein
VGMLTEALNSLTEPNNLRSRPADGDDSVEDRLNRQTSWSSPFSIPTNAAEGSSPVWAGFGI